MNDNGQQQQQSTALAVVAPTGEHIMGLEPKNFDEAWRLSKIALDSGLMPRAVDKPEKVLLIYMRGREMGLTFMQALSSINVIEGKTSFSAELIVARVKQSSVCKFFRLVSSDEKQATYETHRVGNPEPTRYTFTWEDAERLGLANKDNYKKQPKTMLRWRCATTLARIEYPEITLGLYSTDEMEDVLAGNFSALQQPTPPKPVLDAEIVPANGTSAAAPVAETAPTAPSAPPPSAPPQEPLDQKEARLSAALRKAESKERFAELSKELTALPKGPERDRLAKLYAEQISAWSKKMKEAKEAAKTAPVEQQLPLGEAPAPPAEREPGSEG